MDRHFARIVAASECQYQRPGSERMMYIASTHFLNGKPQATRFRADTRVLARIRSMRPGTLFTRESLGPIGSQMAVATTLSRFSRKSAITRVARGRYEIPGGRRSRADPRTRAEMVARETARQHGVRIVPSGAYAAHILGLIPNAPRRITFRSSGTMQTFRTGGYVVEFLNNRPRCGVLAGVGTAAVLLGVLRRVS